MTAELCKFSSSSSPFSDSAASPRDPAIAWADHSRQVIDDGSDDGDHDKEVDSQSEGLLVSEMRTYECFWKKLSYHLQARNVEQRTKIQALKADLHQCKAQSKAIKIRENSLDERRWDIFWHLGANDPPTSSIDLQNLPKSCSDLSVVDNVKARSKTASLENLDHVQAQKHALEAKLGKAHATIKLLKEQVASGDDKISLLLDEIEGLKRDAMIKEMAIAEGKVASTALSSPSGSLSSDRCGTGGEDVENTTNNSISFPLRSPRILRPCPGAVSLAPHIQIESNQKENEELRSRCDEYEKTLASVRQENAGLARNIQDLNSRMEERRRADSLLDKQVAILRKDLERLSTENASLINFKWQSEMSSRKIDEMEHELNALKFNAELKQRELQQQNSLLVEEVAVLRASNEMLHRQLLEATECPERIEADDDDGLVDTLVVENDLTIECLTRKVCELEQALEELTKKDDPPSPEKPTNLDASPLRALASYQSTLPTGHSTSSERLPPTHRHQPLLEKLFEQNRQLQNLVLHDNHKLRPENSALGKCLRELQARMEERKRAEGLSERLVTSLQKEVERLKLEKQATTSALGLKL